MAEETPIAVLERWCDHGADYRVLHLSDTWAVVQMLSCTGEPVDRMESGDSELIDYLEARISDD